MSRRFSFVTRLPFLSTITSTSSCSSSSSPILFLLHQQHNCQSTTPNSKSTSSSTTTTTPLPPVDFRWAHTKETLQTLGGVTKSYTITPYQETGDAYAAMWEAVDNAKHYVTWHTYIAKDDKIGQLTIEKLCQAARRGVKVEFLYDCGGNMTGRSKLVEPLAKAGASVIRYRPFFPQQVIYFSRGMRWKLSPGVRNHRKILVVDDVVAFTGGLNIGNEYAGTSVGGTGKFRDSHCRVTGAEGVRLLKDACADTIQPQENNLGTWMSKIMRWRQWAETTYRFNRRANASFEAEKSTTASAGNINVNDGDENKNRIDNSRATNTKTGPRQQKVSTLMKKFYETHRATLKASLAKNAASSSSSKSATQSPIRSSSPSSSSSSLRSKMRARMKELSTQNALNKKKSPARVSSLSAAWKKLKTRVDEQRAKQQERRSLLQQHRQAAHGDEQHNSNGNGNGNGSKISAFIRARGRVMTKSASSLISLMKAKREQLRVKYHSGTSSPTSEESRTRGEQGGQGDEASSLPKSSAKREPSSSSASSATSPSSSSDFFVTKREELAERFQEIFARQRDKVKDSIAKQQQIIQEKRRRNYQKLLNSSSSKNDASSNSASATATPAVRLVTPVELPIKSVIVDGADVTPVDDATARVHDKATPTSAYIVVACPDQHDNIHNLAVNTDSDTFAQILLCNPLSENFSLQMALWLVVRRSAARVWVTTPYFLPHRKLLNATIEAAKRGVDVRVLTGSKQTTDPWLMWYAQQWVSHRMLKAGVKLYEYHGGSVMHAKTVVVDGVWSSVGSYNWDILSNKLMEASVTALDPEVAAEMEQHFENDMLQSERIVEDTFLQRPLWVQLMCRIIYIFLKISEMVSFRGYGNRDLTSNID